jgi:hypothetical protein
MNLSQENAGNGSLAARAAIQIKVGYPSRFLKTAGVARFER